MQDESFLSLQKSLSRVRLEAYRPANGSNEDVVAHYLWNSALCEALFPMLQQLEVAFRNTLHDSIGRAYGTEEWLINGLGFLDIREIEKIRQAKQDLVAQKKQITEDRIVGELSFGFWTSLADSRYDKNWPKFIKDAFPKAINALRHRPEISSRANKLRKLRNAVFHHHSIWNWKDLRQQHADALALISWIEPEIAKLTQAMDRFPGIYDNGPAVFKKLISN